jgi:hypothetical protein
MYIYISSVCPTPRQSLAVTLSVEIKKRHYYTRFRA